MDAAVARAEFEEVWAVLQALQEQDEVRDDIIHKMQAERRLTKVFCSDSRLRTRVEVLGPTLTLDNLRRAITTRCLDRPWNEMLLRISERASTAMEHFASMTSRLVTTRSTCASAATAS